MEILHKDASSVRVRTYVVMEMYHRNTFNRGIFFNRVAADSNADYLRKYSSLTYQPGYNVTVIDDELKLSHAEFEAAQARYQSHAVPRVHVKNLLDVAREALDYLQGECNVADDYNNNEPGVGQTKDYMNGPHSLRNRLRDAIQGVMALLDKKP